jgi:UDP:flavonoid glycosyltransferase YjiC (YdhE family)
MATIMFFPFPAYGHLNPTLKLAKRLKQAGHRVCYLGLADFEDYVLSQGLEFIPILEGGNPENSSKVDPLHLLGVGTRGTDDEATFRQLMEIEKRLKEIVRDADPDLLFVDYVVGGLAYRTANELGILSAIIHVTLIDGPMLGKPTFDPHNLQLPVLILCPEEFDFPNAAKKPDRYYIEPSIDLQRRESYPFPWHELDESKPLIYCSMGSQSQLYEDGSNLLRTIIEAMRERPDWQLVLAVGRHMDCDVFHPVPENVLLVNWAPQLEMLERASIMINHGGLGAVKECILFGVPMIVFPCRWDQPHNAARVVYHGLGVRGNINDASVEQIHSLIDVVDKDPKFKSRIDAMSKTFHEIENSGRGVQMVESILRDLRGKQVKQAAM